MVLERILDRVAVERHRAVEVGVSLLQLEVLLDRLGERRAAVGVRRRSSVNGFSGMRVSVVIDSSILVSEPSLATPQCSPRARRLPARRACAWIADMPAPTSPLALGLAAFRLWRRCRRRSGRPVLDGRAHAGAARRRGGRRGGERPPPRVDSEASRRRRAPAGRSGPARAGARSGSPRSGSPSTAARRTGRPRPVLARTRLLEPMPDRPPRRPCSAAPPAPRRPRGAAGTTASERLERLDRERVELLDPRHRDARRPTRAARARRCRSRACRSRARAARPAAWSAPGSSSTGWNAPVASAPPRLDEACFRRSSPFGVITTSGRATASSA